MSKKRGTDLVPVRYEVCQKYRSMWVLCGQLTGQDEVWLCVWSTDKENQCGRTVSTKDEQFVEFTRLALNIPTP